MGHKIHAALAALLSGVAGSLLASCAPPQQQQPVVTAPTPSKRVPKASKISTDVTDPYNFETTRVNGGNGGTGASGGSSGSSGSSNSSGSSSSRSGY